MVYVIPLLFAFVAPRVGHASNLVQEHPGYEGAMHVFKVCAPGRAAQGACATPPQVIRHPDPEYTKEARRAKYQGTVVLWIVVGPDGKVHDVRVARSLGLGLDESAIKAVRKWKFKPGEYEGKPVPVQINVEVAFRLY